MRIETHFCVFLYFLESEKFSGVSALKTMCSYSPVKCTVHIYGREETVRYRCANLLWGKGIYQEPCFVLTVLENGEKSILMSTDLTLSAAQIIELYGHRFKIESCTTPTLRSRFRKTPRGGLCSTTGRCFRVTGWTRVPCDRWWSPWTRGSRSI